MNLFMSACPYLKINRESVSCNVFDLSSSSADRIRGCNINYSDCLARAKAKEREAYDENKATSSRFEPRISMSRTLSLRFP